MPQLELQRMNPNFNARLLHGALPEEHLLIGDVVKYDLRKESEHWHHAFDGC